MKHVIGIDLGTCNSTASYKGQKGIDFLHFNGINILPSYVLIQKDEDSGNPTFAVGAVAKNEFINNSKNVAYSTKRLLAKQFSDPFVQEFKQTCTAELVDKDGKVAYRIEGEDYLPEVILAQILCEIKNKYKATTRNDVDGCVITVPAQFGQPEKECINSAAAIADIKVLSIVHEPTAAAIAYQMQHEIKEDTKILIFDLGAGTLDISVLKYKDKNFNVLGVGGCTQFGGCDFDNLLFNEVIKQYTKDHEGFDISKDTRSKAQLLQLCEQGKIFFNDSSSPFSFTCDAFQDQSVKIRKKLFESLIQPKVDEIPKYLDQSLIKANIKAKDINYVIPIGGTTCIPLVLQKLKEYFGEEKIVQDLDVFHSVSIGAVYIAESLPQEKKRSAGIVNVDEQQQNEIKPVLYHDILSYSIGMKTKGDKYFKFLEAGKAMRKEITYAFECDETNKLVLEIYQGEDNFCANNIFINEITVELENKISNVKITMGIDEQGNVYVKIADKDRKPLSDIKIIEPASKLSQKDLDNYRQITRNNERLKNLEKTFNEKFDNLHTMIETIKANTSVYNRFMNELYAVEGDEGGYESKIRKLDDIEKRFNDFKSSH